MNLMHPQGFKGYQLSLLGDILRESLYLKDIFTGLGTSVEFTEQSECLGKALHGGQCALDIFALPTTK